MQMIKYPLAVDYCLQDYAALVDSTYLQTCHPSDIFWAYCYLVLHLVVLSVGE